MGVPLSVYIAVFVYVCAYIVCECIYTPVLTSLCVCMCMYIYIYIYIYIHLNYSIITMTSYSWGCIYKNYLKIF